MSEPQIRVLLVDDDPMQVELVERALSRSGFEVRGTATVAAMAIEAQRFDPDIVLIDVNMPDSTGDEAIAAGRAAVPRAKLVLYSAWEESKLRGIAQKVGADGFLSKSESVLVIAEKLRAFKP